MERPTSTKGRTWPAEAVEGADHRQRDRHRRRQRADVLAHVQGDARGVLTPQRADAQHAEDEDRHRPLQHRRREGGDGDRQDHKVRPRHDLATGARTRNADARPRTGPDSDPGSPHRQLCRSLPIVTDDIPIAPSPERVSGSGCPAPAADENGPHADRHDTDNRHLFDVSTGERQPARRGRCSRSRCRRRRGRRPVGRSDSRRVGDAGGRRRAARVASRCPPRPLLPGARPRAPPAASPERDRTLRQAPAVPSSFSS